MYCILFYRNGIAHAHIGRECFLPISIGLGLQRRSPYKKAMDRKILQLKEAGIVEKWLNDAADAMNEIRDRKLVEKAQRDKSLALSDFQGPIIILVALLICDVISLILEMSMPNILATFILEN